MYYTGAVNTTELMLDAIQGAAIAQGWTVPHRGADTGGGDTNEAFRPDVLYLRDGSGYDFAMAFEGLGTQSNLRLYGIDGQHNVGETTENQAGAISTTNLAYIPCLSYHLFVDSNHVYGLIEGEVGHFRHFGLGQLDKGDAYPGGNFIFGQHSAISAAVHSLPFSKGIFAQHTDATFAALVGGDGNPAIWRTNNGIKTFPDRVEGGVKIPNGMVNDLVSANADQYNRRHVFIPFYNFVARQGGYRSPIGTPPNIRMTGRLSAAANETLVLGPDTWRLYPIGRWGSASAATESGELAMVYFSG